MSGTAPSWAAVRRPIIRDATVIGLATGAYALSFGALSVASGLSVVQTSVLSLFMFTGASQFALVGVVGAGGTPFAAAVTAILLGIRNAFYGLRMAPLLRPHGLQRFAAAQLTIDESTAMSIGRDSPRAARLGFWATGVSVFVFWNLGTLVGALGAQLLRDPRTFGFDAAAPAAFLALLAPRLRAREPWAAALLGAGVAIAAVPLLPTGVPILLAAAVAALLGLRPGAAPAPVVPGTEELP